MGFDEPPVEGGAAEVDLVIAPALAVDERGHRLGYGRGYYDRLLARLQPATTIVVAYDFQLIGEVPTTTSDVALDWVVTDRRSFRAGDELGQARLEPFDDGEPTGASGASGVASAPGVASELAPEPRAGVKVIARPGRGLG